MLTCPVCHAPLMREDRAFRGAEGHSFDVAREGYVNLLAGRAAPPEAGDSRAMLRARQRFIAGGHYAPLVATLCGLAAEAAGERATLLDAGCGEGTYTAAVADVLAGHAEFGAAVGIDIAKDAARIAAKQYAGVQFAVADVWARLPIADASVGVLLNVFAPRNPAEFARVVAPGGRLLVALPAPGHLAALRDTLDLIGIEEDKVEKVQAAFAEGFRLAAEERVTVPLALEAAALRDLVGMMPGSRHLTAEAETALAALPGWAGEARFVVLALDRV